MKPGTKPSGHSKGAAKPATTGAGAAAKVMAGAASKVASAVKTPGGASKGAATKGGAAKKGGMAKKGAAAKALSEEQKAAIESERKRREEELERKLEAERQAQEEERRKRKEKEEEMRAEMFRLIREEEDRIRKREELMKAREKEYKKKKLDIFELAFDDELVDVQKLVGIADANGVVQRNCAATPTGRLLCACLSDPLFNGPTSATTYVEVGAANENNVTPLSEAAVGGAATVAEELLRHGAAAVIDLQDSHGRTPLFRAAFMKKPQTVAVLLRYGADASIRNNDNESPHECTSDPQIREMLEAYTEDNMATVRATLEAERSSCWQAPPPEPDPSELVPKTDHSCKISLRDLADKLDDVRKAGKRQPLIVDLSSNAQTFLRYRDTNMLMTYKPGDMDPETMRIATLGAVRFGKPIVIDNGDLVLEWGQISGWFDAVRPGLWDMLCDCSFTKDLNFMKIVKPEDGDNFKEGKYSQHCLDHFQLILVTKLPEIPPDFADHFYLITTA